MWLLISIVIILSVPNYAASEVHPLVKETYAEVLNYHKSLHLFYQDWICDSYEKANLTAKEQEYYDSLFTNQPAQRPPNGEVYSLVSALNKNYPTEKVLQSIMGLFKDFHDELVGYLEESMRNLDVKSSGFSSRKKRQADDTMSQLLDLMSQLGNLGHLPIPKRRAIRRPIRQAIFELGRGIWRKFLRLRRRNRQARLNDSPDDNNPAEAPPPSPGDIAAPPPAPGDIAAPPPSPGDIAAPPPPDVTPEKPDENIPTAPPGEEDKILDRLLKSNPGNSGPPKPPPPPGNAVAPPPPGNVLAASPPGDQAPPVPLRTPVTPSERIPTADPKLVDIIFRKRRSVDDRDEKEREEFFELTKEKREMFESALRWMMTARPDGYGGLSNYDIFVKKHRMVEYPDAYSREDNFAFHSKVLNRFEFALGQFNPMVKLPYIDVCAMILKPVSEVMDKMQAIVRRNDNIVKECSWIGGNLKRSYSLSTISVKKLEQAFHCSNSSATLRSFGMDEYAAVHSIFGPCVAGGSHMACPSCAVSDPIFWLLYANIERVLLSEV